MPGGGTLTIATGDVDLDEEFANRHAGARPGRYVMLSVRDTGAGMDAATRARAFEPFYTTKEVGKGTGLGLSTVYGIVKQSGGYVSFSSELGVGTTFKVFLPRVAEAAHDPGPAPPAFPARGSETVLIVEDEEALRRAAGRILASAGYAVLQAADGAAALRLLADHSGPLHLLLTDMVMPRMAGPEVAQRIGALRAGIKVLFSSGYSEDVILGSGALDPQVHFIPKPYSAQALLAKVREVLDGPG
jgi:CheY-like chemotaxis protein